MLRFTGNRIKATKHNLLSRFLYIKIAYKLREFVTMVENVKIGTHNGTFHCDEALACFMLKTLPRYKDAVIIRSRDTSILDTCDIVVDVGGKYDHSKLRYDHHMRDFNESVSTVIKKPGYDWQMKLSSAGLIYCHFGIEIIKEIAPQLSDCDVETIFKQIYDTFIIEIDAIDNGVPICNGKAAYGIVTHLSSRIQFLNPAWNSKNADYDKLFLKAMELTGQEFIQHVTYAVNVWLPARFIVQDAVAKRFEVDPSGEIIELSEFVPFIEHIFIIEKEQNIQPLIKYAIYQNNGYCIRCIPEEPGSFVCRLFLPEPWAGLRNEKLVSSCEIEGAEFVHTVRFFGINKTEEGALMMARKALEIGKNL